MFLIFFLAFIAVMCIAYYLVIVIYTGTLGGFNLVWPVAGILLAVIAVIMYRLRVKNISVPVPVKTVLGILVGASLAFFLVIEGLVISGMKSDSQPGLEYIIVLGAKVKGDDGSRLTRTLHRRLLAAEQYLKDNPECIAIVSGGQGADESVTEAFAMKRYLVESGIAEDRILMEDKATDTDENISLSMDIINSRGGSDLVGVVTSNYHMYRALKVCEKQGIKPVGITSASDSLLIVNYMVREFFGILKYKISGQI